MDQIPISHLRTEGYHSPKISMSVDMVVKITWRWIYFLHGQPQCNLLAIQGSRGTKFQAHGGTVKRVQI